MAAGNLVDELAFVRSPGIGLLGSMGSGANTVDIFLHPKIDIGSVESIVPIACKYKFFAGLFAEIVTFYAMFVKDWLDLVHITKQPRLAVPSIEPAWRSLHG